MHNLAAWSWVITVVSIAAFFISGQWLPWGWLVVAIPVQVIYLLYGYMTGQPGYYVSVIFFFGIGILNFRKARKLVKA